MVYGSFSSSEAVKGKMKKCTHSLKKVYVSFSKRPEWIDLYRPDHVRQDYLFWSAKEGRSKDNAFDHYVAKYLICEKKFKAFLI